MKIMVVNSKLKQKSKAILGVIRNLVLNFSFYFVTAILYEKVPYTCKKRAGKTPNTLSTI